MSETLLIITRAVTLLNSAIALSASTAKYRRTIALAVAENRDITDMELEALRQDAVDSVEDLGDSLE